jgi:hypothetical protein
MLLQHHLHRRVILPMLLLRRYALIDLHRRVIAPMSLRLLLPEVLHSRKWL